LGFRYLAAGTTLAPRCQNANPSLLASLATRATVSRVSLRANADLPHHPSHSNLSLRGAQDFGDRRQRLLYRIPRAACVCVCVCARARVCVCVCARAYVCVHIYILMYTSATTPSSCRPTGAREGRCCGVLCRLHPPLMGAGARATAKFVGR
jgi:hypothetical protein